MIRRIRTKDAPIFRRRTQKIEKVDLFITNLLEDMAETMYAAPGIGLAANQVGEPLQLLVYDLTPRDQERNLCVLMNPEIVSAEGEIIYDEACLSVIDFSAEVKRHAMVKVRGFDRHGKPVDIEAEGLMAICLQHEIDHLKGKLFIDHISSLKRALYKRRLQKMLKNEKD